MYYLLFFKKRPLHGGHPHKLFAFSAERPMLGPHCERLALTRPAPWA